MQMDRYIETFAENQIDGELIVSLDPTALKELGLNKTDIKKLEMFVKGWRPNQAYIFSCSNQTRRVFDL